MQWSHVDFLCSFLMLLKSFLNGSFETGARCKTRMGTPCPGDTYLLGYLLAWERS